MADDDLARTLKDLRFRREAAFRVVTAYDRAIEALEAVPRNGNGAVGSRGPEAPAESKADAPRGIEAVSRVLEEAGRPLTVKQITEELRARGWIKGNARAPVEATRVALRRLRDRDGRYMKMLDGRWTFKKEATTV